MKHVLVFILSITLMGCAGMLPFLAKAAQGAQWIATALDVAEAGAGAYYAKHPSQEEREVFDGLRDARSALEAYDRAVAIGNADTVAEKRALALEAYDRLYALLKRRGVLDALPPLGGAETDAPKPTPFILPTTEELAQGQE